MYLGGINGWIIVVEVSRQEVRCGEVTRPSSARRRHNLRMWTKKMAKDPDISPVTMLMIDIQQALDTDKKRRKHL